MESERFKIINPIFVDSVALVSGAGSGIGRQIAREFGRNGVNKLSFVDISKLGLQETKELLSEGEGSV
ncbi:uncharacterized protein Z519_10446 [Cladophialophora bantiana CBS 173.52]|uniref:3-oxoacyl-[acyl-carrier protein] reductase n=1 Tax=Cladophialophora bantiana (strain ATCC 10958 / CBS 173.52 / CDC B-1940 / NIH 8579) TaxID=1442370 RepID=A0A0D2FQX6_CLAB1|nr:uncharacterized protein Z519_10446 [Cladophialophora bantiana CBS 173.52]KIW88962.1 hypothetical protein Z519_10446 [Cladophialophora bantiana CBS 173.52]